MDEVIRAALDKLAASTEFGQAVIEYQMFDTVAYVVYDGQQWSVAAQQPAIKKKMTLNLPQVDCRAYPWFAAAYLDNPQMPGIFAECWQGSAAQWNCSNEMHLMLDMLLQEDQQINA